MGADDFGTGSQAMTNGGRYRRAKGRVVALSAELGDGEPIMATPEWDVRALLAHLVGVALDVADGQVAGYAQPDWTRAQVERAAGASRTQLLEDWDVAAPRVEAVLDDAVGHGLDALFEVLPLIDLLAHEHDMRESVGGSAADSRLEADDWSAISPRKREVLDLQVRLAELAPLEIVTPQGDRWSIGGEPAIVEVTVDRHELWRSLEGRRSQAAVRAFAWSAAPDPYLGAWIGPAFRWPDR